MIPGDHNPNGLPAADANLGVTDERGQDSRPTVVVDPPQHSMDPPETTPPPPPPGRPIDRGGAAWRAKWWILLATLAAAAVVYGSSLLIPARYEASAEVRVTVPLVTGLSRDGVLAANDLASQYAELADSAPVIEATAQELGVGPGRLSGRIQGATVADENIIRVTADADEGPLAARRANAAADALATYVTETSQQQADDYVANAQARLRRLNEQQRQSRSQGERNAIALEQQRVRSQLAQGAASSQPRLEVVARASGGTQTQPRPVLYAVAAGLVMLLVASQVAVAVGTRRTRRL